MARVGRCPAATTAAECDRESRLAVELAGDLRNLWPTCVPGFLKDGRDFGIGDEVLPALRIPVEQHPDPALLIGIAEDMRTVGPVLLSLLKARG